MPLYAKLNPPLVSFQQCPTLPPLRVGPQSFRRRAPHRTANPNSRASQPQRTAERSKRESTARAQFPAGSHAVMTTLERTSPAAMSLSVRQARRTRATMRRSRLFGAPAHSVGRRGFNRPSCVDAQSDSKRQRCHGGLRVHGAHVAPAIAGWGAVPEQMWQECWGSATVRTARTQKGRQAARTSRTVHPPRAATKTTMRTADGLVFGDSLRRCDGALPAVIGL